MVVPKSKIRRTQEPPADLSARELPVIEIAGMFQRIHLSEHPALHFAREAKSRFDDPDGLRGKFGTMYMGLDDYACFIECFGDSYGNTLSMMSLNARNISEVKCKRPLRLVDITAEGAAWIGAAGEISAGDHQLSQHWARALWEHPQKPDGIFYRARHDLSCTCVAIYDRAKTAVKVVSAISLLDTTMHQRLGSMLDRYKFSLVP
jgi:hypothetical protein